MLCSPSQMPRHRCCGHRSLIFSVGHTRKSCVPPASRIVDVGVGRGVICGGGSVGRRRQAARRRPAGGWRERDAHVGGARAASNRLAGGKRH